MQDIKSKLITLYEGSGPAERCGILTKRGKLVEAKNIHDQPELGFQIDPQVMIDYEDKMVATWHTHPQTTSVLSQEDYFGFLCWPDLKHYIVGMDGVREYTITDGLVIEG